MSPLTVTITLLLSLLVGLTMGWVTGDVAQRSDRRFFRWFLAGVLFGPFPLFYLLLREQRPRCQHCQQRVRPLIGLCPHCLTELECRPSRQTVS